jgi:hypothetical protein
MPKKRRKPNGKKIKKRQPIREEFKKLYVDDENILAVRFSHKDEKDTLLVTVKPGAWTGDLPKEYEGYPVEVREGTT